MLLFKILVSIIKGYAQYSWVYLFFFFKSPTALPIVEGYVLWPLSLKLTCILPYRHHYTWLLVAFAYVLMDYLSFPFFLKKKSGTCPIFAVPVVKFKQDGQTVVVPYFFELLSKRQGLFEEKPLNDHLLKEKEWSFRQTKLEGKKFFFYTVLVFLKVWLWGLIFWAFTCEVNNI